MRAPAGSLAAAFAAGVLAGAAFTAGIMLTRPSISLDRDEFKGPRVFRTRIKRVVDGDTVVLENGLHLRYAGIDTPEIVEISERPDAHLARRASDRNRSLVEGREVTVELSEKQVDRYGRLLGRVSLEDGRQVEEVLVREGLARLLGIEALPQELERLETEARREERGIWSSRPARTPSEGAHFVASANSSLYHRKDCPKAANIKQDNLLFFLDKEEAVSTGRRPCPFCLPSPSAE